MLLILIDFDFKGNLFSISLILSIFKETTVHSFMLAFNAPFVRLISLQNLFFFFLWGHTCEWPYFKPSLGPTWINWNICNNHDMWTLIAIQLIILVVSGISWHSVYVCDMFPIITILWFTQVDVQNCHTFQHAHFFWPFSILLLHTYLTS